MGKLCAGHGLEIPATEPALADPENRDCGPEQPLRGGPAAGPGRGRCNGA